MSESGVPEKLSKWVRIVYQAECTRIEIRHISAGSDGGSVVGNFELTDGGDDDPADQFNPSEIYQKMVEDSEEVGGIQKYLLLAFRPSAKAPRERLVLRVDGGTEDGFSNSEGRGADAAMAQALRHNEALMRLVFEGFGTSLKTLADQNKTLAKSLEKASGEKVELWETMSSVAKADREKDEAKSNRLLKEKQTEVIADGLKLLLPGLIQKFGLGSKEASETGLERLVKSLSPEQQATIFSCLSPEQAAALAGLLDSFIKKEQGSKENGVS